MPTYVCVAACQIGQSYYAPGDFIESPTNPAPEYFVARTTQDSRFPVVNFGSVDRDGTLYMQGYNWDDLRFPTSGVNPPGAVTDPTRDTGDGTLVFSASAVNMIAGALIMPHDWKRDSPILPHVHWVPADATAGNVVWRFEYKVAEIGAVFPSYASVDVTAAAGGVSGAHQLTDFFLSAGLPIPGTALAPCILWRVSRLGNDAGDTYANTVKLLEFDIHYLIDSVGSGKPLEK